MSRRHWCLASALGLCVLGIPAIFRGEILLVDTSPDPPVLIGQTVFFEVFSEYPTGNYLWTWRCAGDPPGNWADPELLTDPYYLQHLVFCDRIGTFDNQFWTEEQESPFHPIEWDDEIVQVSVLPPNADAVTGGSLNVDSTDHEVEVRFKVFGGHPLTGAGPIGPYIDGYPQERIRHEDNVTGFTTYSPGWPDFVGPTPERFYWDGSSAEIVDIKAYDMSKAAVQNKPVGFVLVDVHQSNRLVIKNCAGEDQYFEFPAKHFQMIKSGPDTWKLDEVN